MSADGPDATQAYDLIDHRLSRHAQFGEDGIIARILAACPPARRWCVDVGAWDGIHLSNTATLMAEGWGGVLIEADARRAEQLHRNWRHRADVFPIGERVGPGPSELDRLLSRTPTPEDFDILSIDVDGDDYFIWEGLRAYRPGIVAIEANCTFPFNVEFIQRPGAKPPLGSSALSLYYLGIAKGYELVCFNVVNCIFVRKDLASRLNLRSRAFAYLFHLGVEHHLAIASSWSGRLFAFGGDIYGSRRHPLARLENTFVRREAALRRLASRFNIARGDQRRALLREPQ